MSRFKIIACMMMIHASLDLYGMNGRCKNVTFDLESDSDQEQDL